MTEIVRWTDRGLYCEAGDFYIDPRRKAPKAVVTHAHTDHARPGCERYLTADAGLHVLRARLGAACAIGTLRFGETLRINNVRLSFHPAGHILGSAQVRLEVGGEVVVISGDYKLQLDPTCSAFEPLRCRTFITESTFALPGTIWPAVDEVVAAIHARWRENQADQRTTVLFAYSLGKTQRVLAHLDANVGPIYVTPEAQRFVEAYAASGVPLPRVELVEPYRVRATRGRALVIASPAASRDRAWLKKLGRISSALVSGWAKIDTADQLFPVSSGFALSDHADWPGLLTAIDATGAESIGAMHGYTANLISHLAATGRDAWRVEPPRGDRAADANSAQDAGLFTAGRSVQAEVADL
ncbi:MAG: ligase-associated DNA damage response exonuclease [Phycisphaerales bacterium]|nr:ligase-associated DNA damage response exonuclease [Phycisphaerales bacterium]